MVWEFLILLTAIIFWGSPIGISNFLGHCGTVVICLSSLKTVSKNLLFWLLILISIFFASEPRFSLEYVLYASCFFCFGFKLLITNDEKDCKTRRIAFFLIFLAISILDYFHICFAERGSLLLWMPVYLSLYFDGINKKNFWIYLIFGGFTFFLNKISTLIAFITSFKNKIFYLISILSIIAYFYLRQDFATFFLKSFKPRIHIFISCLKGFIDKPFFGHGFGTFALDFPEYRAHAKILGGRTSEYVIHGHNLFSHLSFELGIIGLLFIFVLFYLIYLNKPLALIPLITISLFDSPLVTFSQYLIAGALLVPFIQNYGLLEKIRLFNVNKIAKNILLTLSIIISCYSFIPSLVGHYFYSTGNLDNAIEWDKNNSLYYFTKGAKNLNKDTVKSEVDLKKAVKLSLSIPYFLGFLSAAQLANGKTKEAKINLEKAMKLDGRDGYWCLLYAYANYDNKNIVNEYISKAYKKSPEIKQLIEDPGKSSNRYIGYSKGGDIRLAGFYRTGEKIYFPLPILRND